MTLLITLHTTFATLWFISVYPYYLFIIDLVLLSASSILQIYVARTAPTSIIMIWLRNTLFEVSDDCIQPYPGTLEHCSHQADT